MNSKNKDRRSEEEDIWQWARNKGITRVGQFKIVVEKNGNRFTVEQEELNTTKYREDGYKIISIKSPVYI